MLKNEIAKDLEARLNEMADKFGEYVEMIISEKKVMIDEENPEDKESEEEIEEKKKK